MNTAKILERDRATMARINALPSHLKKAVLLSRIVVSAPNANELYAQKHGRKPVTQTEEQQAWLDYMIRCSE